MHARIQDYTKLLRALVLESTTIAGSGHPTSCLSAIELMAEVWTGGWLNIDQDKMVGVESDQIIFSKGHAAPLLYSLYTLAGLVSREELLTLRKQNSRLEGHPLPRSLPFVVAATGSLGQGIGVAVGSALAQRKSGNKTKTWALLGDSECAEGSIWESMQIASHYQLNNLIVLVDVNRLGQRGETMLGHDLDTLAKRFESFGGQVVVIRDGNDSDAVSQALHTIDWRQTKPIIVLAKTYKGAGISLLQDKEDWHGKVLSHEQYQQAILELGAIDYGLINSVSFGKRTDGIVATPSAEQEVKQLIFQAATSTRQAYGQSLVLYGASYPELVVLDAETSNSTFASLYKDVYPGRFFEMYIAEQNMLSTALGMSRVGKYIPAVSTFAAFLTRAFDQIRIAAYSEAHIIIAGSHAGSSIGEDGASQMGLEDIAMVRSIVGSVVLCPADGYATSALVGLGLKHYGINYLRLTRAVTPLLYSEHEMFEIGGSKTLKQSSQDIVTLLACGITVHESLKAYEALYQKGISVRVIDLYSIKPIDQQALALACKDTGRIIVIEDHVREGGLYSAVLESGVITCPVDSLAVSGIPHSGSPEQVLAMSGIDAAAIVELVSKYATT
jgi:transketolase